MKSDARFPTTQQTWLRECLAESTASEARSRGLRDAREHVMRRYYEPLAAYLGATSYRDIDAPSALVAAFFVDRFGDDTYLQAWKASGLPLRRWLVNGLLFWLRTEVRRRRREERRLGGAHELSLVEHHDRDSPLRNVDDAHRNDIELSNVCPCDSCRTTYWHSLEATCSVSGDD
jgi:hypothetical protein